MNKKLKVIEITPVPYAPFKGDLVVVSLEQLIEAQKKTQKALKEEREEAIKEAVQQIDNDIEHSDTYEDRVKYQVEGLKRAKEILATLSKEGRNK